jgi:hypothetical protein
MTCEYYRVILEVVLRTATSVLTWLSVEEKKTLPLNKNLDPTDICFTIE